MADDTQGHQPVGSPGDFAAGPDDGAPTVAGMPAIDGGSPDPPAPDPAPVADAEEPEGDRPRPKHAHATPRRIAIRRGAVLFLLLIAILTSTNFFRESDSGLLHSIKSGVTSVTGHVQNAASAAVRPVRDGWDWFTELRHARDERDRLKTEIAKLRSEQLGGTVDRQRLARLENLLRIHDATPADYAPVSANIIMRPLVDVARQARIDRGSANGITVNSLVFIPRTTDQGKEQRFFGVLVGRVEHVDAHTADITFLTSPDSAVAARTLLGNTPLGLLKPNALGDLILTGIPTRAAIATNDAVVTMGVGTDTLMSPYPPGLPIGYVSSFSGGGSGGSWTIQVTPYANPNDASQVVIYVPRTATAKRRAGLQ